MTNAPFDRSTSGDALAVAAILLGTPGVDFEETERAALTVLSQGGLLPPLRMAPPSDGRNVEAV